MSNNISEAILFLKQKGGSCSWNCDDMTTELSELLLDASYEGLVTSCIETETWNIYEEKK